jgi:hypothetical protein
VCCVVIASTTTALRDAVCATAAQHAADKRIVPMPVQVVEQRSSELRRDFTSTADMLAADLQRLAKDGASLRGDVCSIAGEACPSCMMQRQKHYPSDYKHYRCGTSAALQAPKLPAEECDICSACSAACGLAPYLAYRHCIPNLSCRWCKKTAPSVTAL